MTRTEDRHPEVRLRELRGPEAQVLGDVGGADAVTKEWFREERLHIAARCLGRGAAAARGGQGVGLRAGGLRQEAHEHQAVGLMLADSATELYAARLMTYKTAWEEDAGRSTRRSSTRRPRCASSTPRRWRTAWPTAWCRSSAGRGYCTDFAAERHFRHVRVDRIWEGTSEIMRSIILNGVLKRDLRRLVTRWLPHPLRRCSSRAASPWSARREAPGKYGYILLKTLIDEGYPGGIFGVNPRGGSLLGRPLPRFARRDRGARRRGPAWCAPRPSAWRPSARWRRRRIPFAIVYAAGFAEHGRRDARLQQRDGGGCGGRRHPARGAERHERLQRPRAAEPVGHRPVPRRRPRLPLGQRQPRLRPGPGSGPGAGRRLLALHQRGQPGRPRARRLPRPAAGRSPHPRRARLRRGLRAGPRARLPRRACARPRPRSRSLVLRGGRTLARARHRPLAHGRPRRRESRGGARRRWSKPARCSSSEPTKRWPSPRRFSTRRCPAVRGSRWSEKAVATRRSSTDAASEAGLAHRAAARPGSSRCSRSQLPPFAAILNNPVEMGGDLGVRPAVLYQNVLGPGARLGRLRSGAPLRWLRPLR